jgi:hypothetical protein
VPYIKEGANRVKAGYDGNIGAIVTVPTGRHSFDLLAYTNASGLTIHNRALSVVDLG